jgi:hypothetical protein
MANTELRQVKEFLEKYSSGFDKSEMLYDLQSIAPALLGGRKSARKAKASAENGRKGGRPKLTQCDTDIGSHIVDCGDNVIGS